MTRHFWNIFTDKKSTEVLHEIEVLTRNFGFIVDYKKFAEDYYILQIDIENIKTEDFFAKLSSVFSLEKFNKITLNISGDDEIFLNIKVTL